MHLTPIEQSGLVAMACLVVIAVSGIVGLVRARIVGKREREALGEALAASEAVSAALSEEALFLSAVLSGVESVIILADRDARIRFVNDRFDQTFGVRSADVIGRPRKALRAAIAPCFRDPNAFIDRDERADERRTSEPRATLSSGIFTDEEEFVIERPARKVLLWSARPVVQGNARIGILVVFRDVTRQREAEEARERLLTELAAQARTDALTGLANRRHAGETLVAEIERARRYQRPLSIALFDLDRFKLVNDQFGHEAGDAVLRAFAEVLRASARGTDVVARWGGEEFLAVLHEADLDAACVFGERVRSAIAAASALDPFVTAAAKARPITVSVGVTTLGEGDDVEKLVRRADHALYRAKDAGRDRVEKEAPIAPLEAPTAS